jgi:hypothetical protein
MPTIEFQIKVMDLSRSDEIQHVEGSEQEVEAWLRSNYSGATVLIPHGDLLSCLREVARCYGVGILIVVGEPTAKPHLYGRPIHEDPDFEEDPWVREDDTGEEVEAKTIPRVAPLDDRDERPHKKK